MKRKIYKAPKPLDSFSVEDLERVIPIQQSPLYKYLEESMVETPAEFQKVAEKHFWELLAWFVTANVTSGKKELSMLRMLPFIILSWKTAQNICFYFAPGAQLVS